MNRTFKTIWNAVRGQIVVVNEATTSHAQAAGESSKGGSTQSASEPQPSFLKTGVAAAVAGVLGLGLATGAYAAAATTDPATDWALTGLDADHVVDVEFDWSGSNYGAAAGGSDAATVWIKGNGSLIGGTYGYYEDWDYSEVVGQENLTGKLAINKLYNQGSLIDSTTYKTGADTTAPQTPGTYWIHSFYNSGTVDIGNLRTDTYLANTSANFKVGTLHAGNAVQIANDGTMTIGDAFLGLTNSFSNFTLGSGDAMATLNYDSSATGVFKNAGTVKITGDLVNYIKLEDTDAAATWDINNWDNHADADLQTVKVVTLTNAAGKQIDVVTLTATDLTTNNGTINADTATLEEVENAGTLAVTGTLTATANVHNAGTITANAAQLQTVTNDGSKSIKVTGLMNVAGTTTNTGAIEAGQITMGDLTNNTGGSVTRGDL